VPVPSTGDEQEMYLSSSCRANLISVPSSNTAHYNCTQGLGVPVPSTGDEQEMYLSSSGRPQRRSRGTTGEYVGSSMAGGEDDQYIDRMVRAWNGER